MPLVKAYCVGMDAREYLASLGRLKWAKMSEAAKAAHIRKMVAGQRRARKHRQAKARGTK